MVFTNQDMGIRLNGNRQQKIPPKRTGNSLKSLKRIIHNHMFHPVHSMNTRGC